MSAEKEVTNQANTSFDQTKIQHWNVICDQPKKINDESKYSDDETEENSGLPKSDVLNSNNETNQFITTVYDFFKRKCTEFLLESCSKLNTVDLNVTEESNTCNLFETEEVSHKIQETTVPERQTIEEKSECIVKSPKKSFKVTESLVSGLWIQSDKDPNLNSPRENNNQENLNSHCDSKNVSQNVEHIQVELSTAEKNELLEFIVRVAKEIQEAETRDEILNSNENNNIDEQIESLRVNDYSEQRDEIKKRTEDSYPLKIISHKLLENTINNNDLNKSHHESTMTMTNFCNNTDTTQGGSRRYEESCLSTISEDEVIYMKTVNNSAKQKKTVNSVVLAEDMSSHYRLEQSCRGVLYPMNDKNGPFFIDRYLVDVNQYQKGLEFKDWNPVQALYEICTCCNWGMPEFEQINYIEDVGFLFSVKVNGYEFNSQKLASTKKKAKCFAATQFLHYIGFKFNFENLSNTSVNYNVSDTNWQKRDNMFLERNSKYMADNFPYNRHRQESNSFSNISTRNWHLRSTVNKIQHSCSRDSEKDSKYNNKKQHRSWKISKTQSNFETELNEYKKILYNKLEDNSDHSCICELNINSEYKRRHSHKYKRKSEYLINNNVRFKKHKNKKSSYEELEDSSDFSPGE